MLEQLALRIASRFTALLARRISSILHSSRRNFRIVPSSSAWNLAIVRFEHSITVAANHFPVHSITLPTCFRVLNNCCLLKSFYDTLVDRLIRPKPRLSKSDKISLQRTRNERSNDQSSNHIYQLLFYQIN